MLFEYRYHRKKTVYKILLNMALVPAYVGGFFYFSEGNGDLEELRGVIGAIAVTIEVILATIAIWFWKRPAAFSITLSPKKLESFHPIFPEWTWAVEPKEITEIENRLDQHGTSIVWIHTSKGQRFQLCPNFLFDRKNSTSYCPG